MSTRPVAVVHCGQLITLAGPARARTGLEMRELSVIADGSFTIRNGKIGSVGPTADILRLIGDAGQVLDAGGRLVTPGLVDAHTHFVFAGNRADEFELRAIGATYPEIAARGGGIKATVRKTREASEQELAALAKPRVSWMLKNGTTTAESKSGYGLTFDDELKILRALRRVGRDTRLKVVPTLLAAHAVPPEFESRRDAYVNLIIDRLLPVAHSEGLAQFSDIFVEPGYFEPSDARKLAARCSELGIPLRMHVDQLSNTGGAALAAELGATSAEHLEQTGAEGIAALKAAGVQPVLLPGSVFGLGLSRYADARAMIDAGLAVVVATDFNPGSSPTPSMPFAMSLACNQMKMTPAEALTAGTVNAAYSLGRGNSVGSIDAGKDADFVIWDCEDWREVPYWVGAPLAHGVFIDGQSVEFET